MTKQSKGNQPIVELPENNVKHNNWYKDAVIYQLHVKSFFDSNNDGIGDFPGLTMKLDYLEKMGITAIWLLPFYPSPLKDDGYDIADYMAINPSYGTMTDFKIFLREAHRRGMRVITEMVLNHTSDQHEWFKRSRTARPGSVWRNYYVWSDTPDKYLDARIIFKDFESSNWSWDSVANAYFWHRFYSHQPDLNFESPHVRKAMFRIIDFWMGMGVDGMRLDAVPYLYEKDGTDCENLSETYVFLRSLRTHLDEKFENRMLLAEANQWPEDAAAYFGKGDICHMAFHFPLMPRMFMALQMEEWFPIVDILNQTPAIPENAQWAIFLRNHDELTLEMVTDEERDYMYRYYAHDPKSRINLGIRRRLAPLLRNSRRRIEIMNMLLFSLPGTPIVYYGDEIGMGDNHYLGDRNGVRTPMQWSADRNAGFSYTNPQKLYLPVIIDPEYHYETINVETEEHNVSSILWWIRRVIAMRRRYKAFSQGELVFIQSDNANVFTFIRKYREEIILVIVNLSRFAQVVKVDLQNFVGFFPRDIFSGNRFPEIRDRPYVLTMGFHDYFWLELKKEAINAEHARDAHLPDLTIEKNWKELFRESTKTTTETELLPSYLQRRTSAGCRNMPIRATKIEATIPFSEGTIEGLLLIVRVKYAGGAADTIFLPLHALPHDQIDSLLHANRGLLLAQLSGGFEGYLYDCIYNDAFHKFIVKMQQRKRVRVNSGEILEFKPGKPGRKGQQFVPVFQTRIIKTGKISTTFSYHDAWFCKVYRRIEEGINPEGEVMEYLCNRMKLCDRVPQLIGTLRLTSSSGAEYTLGTICSYVKHAGDTLTVAYDMLIKYFEEIITEELVAPQCPQHLDFTRGAITEIVEKIASPAIAMAERIGILTAEMHNALSKNVDDPAFEPQPFSMLYQRSLYQAMRSKVRHVFGALEKMSKTRSVLHDEIGALLASESVIVELLSVLTRNKIRSLKIRIHGDYHLSQLLHVGTQFVIKGFEGDPDMPLSERRLKRSPLRDLAAMMHSFYFAANSAMHTKLHLHKKKIKELEPWAELWFTSMSSVFVDTYTKHVAGTSLVPDTFEQLHATLKPYLIERSVDALEASIHEHPDQIRLNLKTIDTFLRL